MAGIALAMKVFKALALDWPKRNTVSLKTPDQITRAFSNKSNQLICISAALFRAAN